MPDLIKKRVLVLSALLFSLPLIANAQGRFTAPNVNAPADTFSDGLTQGSNDINSSYLIARFNAKTQQALKDGIDLSENIGQITSSANESAANILQSVVVLPGVNVDEIVIINQNQGDGIIVNQ